MSSGYTLPSNDQEVILYFPTEIGKRKDHLNLKTILYSRWVLENVIKEYNIQADQSIGFCADIKTAEYFLAEMIEGYMKYWGLNITSIVDDIDFEHPLPNKL